MKEDGDKHSEDQRRIDTIITSKNQEQKVINFITSIYIHCFMLLSKS
jgi:hypothetical protein